MGRTGWIDALACLPVDFAADSEIVPGEHVAAKAGIGAPGKRRAVRVGLGRLDGADAERNVNFLGLRKIRERYSAAQANTKRTARRNVYFKLKPPEQ